jgi:hypothetical protein
VSTREHDGVTDPLRVSDTERDRVIRDLTKHCGDGRLTLDELEERITLAYAAMTRAELEATTRDLPSTTTPAVRQSGPPIRVRSTASKHEARRAGEIALKIHLLVYLAVMALLVMIYAISNFGGYFWPIWTAMPWGVALGVHAGIHKIANSD